MTEHRSYTYRGGRFNDEPDNDPQIVQCPECGMLEIWSAEEQQNHGACRSLAYEHRPCPECGEVIRA